MDANLEMELTPYMAEIVERDFDLQIEFLQSTKEPLPDGRTRYFMTVKGEKAELIKEFVLKLISMSHTKNLN